MSEVRFVKGEKVFHSGRRQYGVFESYWDTEEEYAIVMFDDEDGAIVTSYFLEPVNFWSL